MKPRPVLLNCLHPLDEWTKLDYKRKISILAAVRYLVTDSSVYGPGNMASTGWDRASIVCLCSGGGILHTSFDRDMQEPTRVRWKSCGEDTPKILREGERSGVPLGAIRSLFSETIPPSSFVLPYPPHP